MVAVNSLRKLHFIYVKLSDIEEWRENIVSLYHIKDFSIQVYNQRLHSDRNIVVIIICNLVVLHKY